MNTTHALVLLIAGLAAAVDIRTRRIPNVLTLGGALAASLYFLATDGPAALLTSASGWAVGIILFMPLYLLRGLGAGDVKLLGTAGAWLGPSAVVSVALYAVLAGGLLAFGIGAARGYLGVALRNLRHLLQFWRLAGIQPVPGLTIDDAAGPRLPYGLAIAAGTIVAVVVVGVS